MSAAPPPSFPSDIGVSIVAHNARGYIGRLLDSLSAAGCPPSSICVVDVASTDGLGEWLAAAWPGVLRSRLERNDGPSPGRNVGIRWWTGRRFVLLLDADVQLEPDTVTLLTRRWSANRDLEDWQPGGRRTATGPISSSYADTHLHFICEAINPYLDRSLAERGTDVRDIGVASTCALLLDRGVAIEAGLFDERYFIGKEDGDFTHRVKLAGHGILDARTHASATSPSRARRGSSTTRSAIAGTSSSRTTRFRPSSSSCRRSPSTRRCRPSCWC